MQAVVEKFGPHHSSQLGDLFLEIAADKSGAHFHPHPFTRDVAEGIARYTGKDLYFGLFVRGALTGYGMLRGWDEGFAVPSLGIYLSPSIRGKGLARFFMSQMHARAQEAGAEKIRLKVHPKNVVARQLYESLGYQFGSIEDGQQVGIVLLAPSLSNSL